MKIHITIVAITSLLIHSCKKFIEIDPPRTDLVQETVFSSDAAVSSAVNGLYQKLIASGSPADGGTSSVSFLAALSADEIITYSSIGQAELLPFNSNQLVSTNRRLELLWTNFYQIIYSCNLVLDGLENADKLSLAIKNQSVGEAKFIRAFCYFYLVNLFGDVPLSLTSDYVLNTSIPKSSSDSIYAQLEKDLTEAKSLLPRDYSFFMNNERVRATKAVAEALLARIYLYEENWPKAQAESTLLIENTELYELVDLSQVFLTTSREAIWQLGKAQGLAADKNAFNYIPRSNSAFTNSLAHSFESSDNRLIVWVDSALSDGKTYYWAKKYKSSDIPPTEYTTVLRLSEQYLIRSECRAQLDDIEGAKQDLNVVRNRAGLQDTPANDKESLLTAIANERRVELFTEWGHRWLDLKRTGKSDEVIGALKATYQPYAQLYPIPQKQILNDPAMADGQNPGYH